jgi:hypothetical protein
MRRTRITTTLAALAVSGLLGACGGDDDSSDAGNDDVASASDDDSNEQEQGDDQGDDQADVEQELLDWVDCMRDEGVDLPDPTRDANGNLVLNGNGIAIGGGGAGTSTNDGNEAGGEPTFTPGEMEAAEEVCGPPPSLGAGDISDEELQDMQASALEFAQCMRDEGIEDFPDPDFSDMGPGGAPQSRSSDDDGGQGGEGGEGGGTDEQIVLGPFGEIDLDDPEVAAAFEACQNLIGPPGQEGGPVGASSSDEAEA